jgi:hypothetical protein
VKNSLGLVAAATWSLVVHVGRRFCGKALLAVGGFYKETVNFTQCTRYTLRPFTPLGLDSIRPFSVSTASGKISPENGAQLYV